MSLETCPLIRVDLQAGRGYNDDHIKDSACELHLFVKPLLTLQHVRQITNFNKFSSARKQTT